MSTPPRAYGAPPPHTAPSLVGRDRELAALRAHLAAALGGRGSLVLIGGEAGIGKSALTEALCAEAAEQGALVLVGRCFDISETPPYGPWREVFDTAPLDDGLPVLPTAVLLPERQGEALASQETIVARVRAYLAALAPRQPLVLLLEDLHWADPASLDLLRALARNLAALPLLLPITYRADELAGDHPFAALLPTLVREARAARLDLRPLGEAAISALVAARYALAGADHARLVAYLAGRTEGNALFLGELLRTLEGEGLLHGEGGRWAIGDVGRAPVPPLLRQVIAGRVARLGPDAARLLAAAAVIGQEVPFTLWRAVVEADEDALLDLVERAVEAGLLAETPEGSGVRFAHALTREALYTGLPGLRRRRVHQRAAAALLATAQPDPDAVAHHLQRAADPRAVEWFVRAGLRARASAASITAAARFAAAARLLAGDTARAGERGWLLLLAAQLLVFTDTAAALRHLDEAELLARLAGDGALVAHICGIRGHVLCHRPGDLRAGVAELERAVAAVEALPPEYRRWSAGEVALARLGALLPEHERATLSTQTRPLPAALGLRGLLANQYGFSGRYREARALGEATVAAALADDPGRRDAPGRFGLANAHAALGQPAEARREYALWRAHLYAANALYVVEYTCKV